MKNSATTKPISRRFAAVLPVMKMLSWAGILALVATAHQACADTVLLSDNFSGAAGSFIGGNALTANNINSAVWASSGNAVYTNGNSGTFSTGDNSLITVDTGSYAASNPGVYTLSLTLNSSGGTSGDWYGFGWSAAAPSGISYTLASSGSVNYGYAWMLLRGNGQLNVYAGPGASAGGLLLSTAMGTYNAGAYDLKLVLDTTGANYALDAYVNNVQLDLNGATAGDTYAYSANPPVQYVGISSAGSTPVINDSFSNLSLTGPAAVPEPSTIALGVLGGGLLLVWRRKLAI